jgi:hypothetical protein
MVHIHHQARHFRTETARSSQFLPQAHIEVPTVSPTRQVIRQAALYNTLTVTGILESNGGDTGEVLEKRRVQASMKALFVGTAEAKHSDKLFVPS